jgi:hypothetical protein
MKAAWLAMTLTLQAGVGACSGTRADSRPTASKPGARQPAAVDATSTPSPAAVGDQVLALVQSQFYDPGRAADLRELRTSHTVYFPRYDPKANQLLSIFRQSPTDPRFAYDSIGAEVAAVRIDGETLEGVGVQPHVQVPDDFRFAQGRDPQLRRALQIAAEQVDGQRGAQR